MTVIISGLQGWQHPWGVAPTAAAIAEVIPSDPGCLKQAGAKPAADHK